MYLKNEIETPDGGEDVENLDNLYIACENVKWSTKKLNMPLPYEPGCDIVLYSKTVQKQVHMKTCTQMFSRFIFNNQKLVSTKMSFNRQRVKKTVAPSYNGVLLSNKEKTFLINSLTLKNL